MIPPYKDNFRPSAYGRTLEEYIRNTRRSADAREVRQMILHFLWKLEKNGIETIEKSKRVLHHLLETEQLLAKTQIISLGSWRNCVLCVRPNQVLFYPDNQDVFTALEQYEKDAEVLFLYLHEEPVQLFRNPSLRSDYEQENAEYFRRLALSWRQEYEMLRKEKIDALLDRYNLERDKDLLQQVKALADD